MNIYDPKQIEKKWQKYWEDNKTFEVEKDKTKEKFYSLIEFPYPSGVGLHVGHPRPFTAMDIVSRKKRMDGFNVLYPIGFDAFGLPTENYAIKTGRPPAEVTAENIANFTRQLKMLGYSFDWSRVVDTTDPTYFKWTQWLFLQFHKHGLAYKKTMPINWCLSCKIGLANEEVVDGKCERCGGDVEKRDKEQWMLAITKYADSLLAGLEDVDYIPQARTQQENWIGRSEGASIKFRVIPNLKSEESRHSGSGSLVVPPRDDVNIEVFTTRPDTLFGATYMVLAPEGEYVQQLKDYISNWDEVEEYINKAKLKSDLERTELQKEKTGIKLEGMMVINPVNNEEIPVFVADYVLANYGTGAIMAVPGHDERDFEFAKKYDLEIREVISGGNILESAYSGDGVLVNSDFLNNKNVVDAKKEIISWLEEKHIGKGKVQFKLRDWVFSRQRYWGEPIPLVYCENCAEKSKKLKVKSQKVVLIHGISGHAQENWFPWLKDELEHIGYTVYVPNLPHAEHPNLEEWVDELCKLPIDDGDEIVVVGRSLGAPVACKFVEQKNIKIKKLILVAPTGTQQEKDWSGLKSVGLDEKALKCIHNFNSAKKDWKHIVSLTEESVIYLSDNDPYIPLSVKNDYQELNARIKEFSGKGHFNRKVGMTQFQAILSEFNYEEHLNSGWIPLPEDQLPLELPQVEKYEPTETGESPLAAIEEWVNTTCPQCGGSARRETDTMPNWAGSSWYFLRYMDPHNDKEFASPENLKYWAPVDWYNGGMEHTVLHLLYSRFWNQFLYDIGLVPTKEPYKKRTSHGMILAEDGEKMSKSRGNVINPDEMVEQFGTDAFRLYIMFMGPFDQAVAWNTDGVKGMRRFLDKVWNLQEKVVVAEAKDNNLTRLVHQTIKKVTQDIDKMNFNTAISSLMEFTNVLTKEEKISKAGYAVLVKLLSVFAPHIAEELWSEIGNTKSIAYEAWPQYDESQLVEDEVTLAVQVNGKLRATLVVPADITEEDAKARALGHGDIGKWLEGREPKKVIYVKAKLVSIVV